MVRTHHCDCHCNLRQREGGGGVLKRVRCRSATELQLHLPLHILHMAASSVPNTCCACVLCTTPHPGLSCHCSITGLRQRFAASCPQCTIHTLPDMALHLATNAILLVRSRLRLSWIFRKVEEVRARICVHANHG